MKPEPRQPARPALVMMTCPQCCGSGVIARPMGGARYEWTCTNCIGLGEVPAPVQANTRET